MLNPNQLSRLITEDVSVGNGLLSEAKLELPTRTLGKTGRRVAIFGLGGQGALESQGSDKNNIEIIRRAYELGVTYFDTARTYSDSELYYGRAIRDFRNKITLATKSRNRTKNGALKNIDESLKRLKTDHIDIWQVHHLSSIDEIDQISKKGGALEAFLEMREQGVAKHIGFTGHEDPDVLAEMVNRFGSEFDTILMPINAADVHMKPSFIRKVLPIANKKKLGVIGMKVFSQGYIFKPKGITTTLDPIHYSLSQDIDTVIIGCDDISQLEENVLIAKMFKQLDDSEMRKIEDKTSDYLRQSCFFRKKYGGYDSIKNLKEKYLI